MRGVASVPLSGGIGLVVLALATAGVLYYSGLWHGVIAPSISRGLQGDTAVAERPRGGGVSYNAVDGDSLRSNRGDIRLLGIDAPELHQTCRDQRGRQWACGREAHARLKALVSRGDVRCVATGRDRFNRALALCSAGQVSDVGEVMVRDGYAVDFMNGGRYAGAEAEARRARRGIWAGEFESPQDWRRRNPRDTNRT